MYSNRSAKFINSLGNKIQKVFEHTVAYKKNKKKKLKFNVFDIF